MRRNWILDKYEEWMKGRELRDEGVKLVEINQLEWRDSARAWVVGRCAKPGEFNSDDLIEAIGYPPGHPNAIGAIWLWAKRSNLVELAGYSQATRSASRGRRVLIYRGLPPEEQGANFDNSKQVD